MSKLKHFPFLKLPSELREMIYHDALLGSPREDALAYDIDDSILQTCKQIHAEGRIVLFKINVFEAAIWLPTERRYTPWPILPSNQDFLSRVQHLALYWDMRQFIDVKWIRFESVPLRSSILNLKRICMALLQARTRLRTLRVTMKVPGGIDFGHMPLGQYPFPSMPTFTTLSQPRGDPDVLAPLKELRVQQVIFAGDFSEASAKTVVYLEDVRAIMEGFKPKDPWVFPETKELNLKLMVRRNIYYYFTPDSHPSWEGILHRELFFYAGTLREYHIGTPNLKDGMKVVEALDIVRKQLSYPATEKPKGLTKVNLGPLLLLLEEVFQNVLKSGMSGENWPPKGLLAARDYFFARPGIRKTMEDASLAT